MPRKLHYPSCALKLETLVMKFAMLEQSECISQPRFFLKNPPADTLGKHAAARAGASKLQ